MPKKILGVKPIPNPEAGALLKGLGRELNQFQKRTLEYVTQFSKVEPEDAKKLIEVLVKEHGLEERLAVQLINSMPETVHEARVFFPRHKFIESEKLQEIVKLLNEHRK